MPKKKTPERQPSAGSLALVETLSGELRVQLDFHVEDTTDPKIIKELRAAIVGLSYIYDKESANIVNVGNAYIEGVEQGAARATQEAKKPKANKNYKDSTIGFNTILKEEE